MHDEHYVGDRAKCVIGMASIDARMHRLVVLATKYSFEQFQHFLRYITSTGMGFARTWLQYPLFRNVTNYAIFKLHKSITSLQSCLFVLRRDQSQQSLHLHAKMNLLKRFLTSIWAIGEYLGSALSTELVFNPTVKLLSLFDCPIIRRHHNYNFLRHWSYFQCLS